MVADPSSTDLSGLDAISNQPCSTPQVPLDCAGSESVHITSIQINPHELEGAMAAVAINFCLGLRVVITTAW